MAGTRRPQVSPATTPFDSRGIPNAAKSALAKKTQVAYPYVALLANPALRRDPLLQSWGLSSK
jgi:hypothetical protein